jgi:hypothetical protein
MMMQLSKPDKTDFRKTFFRDLKILLAVSAITAIVIVLTLYAVAKGLID